MPELLQPRDVPLGNHRALTVRRTLPHRDRAFVGAWCFADHYGPARATMDVAPHPHTGLQTVSWLFEGSIEHRDSLGTVSTIRPGEMNLMTAGSGICHSEVSAADAPLHGVQLWIALPEAARLGEPDFVHHVPEVVFLDGGVTARVMLGDLPGVASSPVATHTPLMGAELVVPQRAALQLDLDPEFEYAVLVDSADSQRVTVGEQRVANGELLLIEQGTRQLSLRGAPEQSRLIVLGGVPFDEEVVMWWNFMARSHDEIEQFSRDWNAGDPEGRFGEVRGYQPAPGAISRIPAPQMPPGRLLPTVRRGRHRH